MPRSRSLRTLAALGVAALAGGGLAGCVGGPGGIQAPDSWTVLTYEIADTNLEPFMMADVEEMGTVGTRPGFSLISFVDRAEGYTATPVLGIDDWVGAKVLEVGKNSATELADLGDVNTGDPGVLADFITQSIKAYPAAHYSLIISDHGASWPGVGGDESANHDVLTLDELDQAISQGLEGAGVDKLDLLGFDACLMATFEVASTLAPVADRLLASQELEPGHGWNYGSLDAAYRGADVDELGSALIEGFRSQAIKEGTENEITLSLIDLTQMSDVDDALTAFSSALTDRVAGIAPTVGRSLAETLGFGSNPDPRFDVHMKDLAILAGEIGVDALDVSDQADALVRAINDVVLDKVDGQATRGATGLSIYFPPQGSLYDSQYAAVAEKTGWSEFLAAYYDAGADIPTDQLPDFVTNDASVQLADGGLYISGQFGAGAEANIADAYVQYGVINDDGSITLFGDQPAQVSTDGSGVAGAFYDLTYLTISDGVDSSTAYFSFSQDDAAGTATMDVPIEYHPPSSSEAPDVPDALLSLGINTATGSIVSEVYYAYNADAGNYGELATEPTGSIFPLVQVLYADGSTEWLPTSEAGLSADLPNLVYGLQPLPSGTRLYVELWVVDYGGNADYVNAVVTVP